MRRKKKSQDRIEAEGVDFLNKVAFGFEAIAKERNWIRVPAELNKDLVTKEIKESLMEYCLENRKKLHD